MKPTGLIFFAALALAGCGGGGGNPGTCTGSPQVCGGVSGETPETPAGSALGLYKGTTDSGRNAFTLVLPDGDFWVLYGQSGNATLLGGAEQGSYTTADRTITSPDLVDFSAATGSIARGSMSGTYVSQESIAGSVSFGASVMSFAGVFVPDSTTAPTLADVAGSYAGTLAVNDGSANADIAISSTGIVTGNSQRGGCTITGTVLPNSGVNVFNLNLDVAGGICGNERINMRGVAVVEGTRIYSAGFNGARTEAFTFSGGR
jgi:hypothetical protein